MQEPLKVELTEISPVEKHLKVAISRERFYAVREEVTRQFVKSVHLPGFRPGKAPRDLVENRYRREIQERTRSTVIQEALAEILKNHQLPVIAFKGLEADEGREGDDFHFTLTLEILPEVPLSEIPRLKVKKPVRSITEEEVQKVLDHLRERFTRFRPPEPGERLSSGDRVRFQYTARKEGEPAPDKPEIYEGILSTRYLLPQVYEKLLGTAPGERKQFTLTFDSSPELPEPLRGQTLHYEVEILSLEKAIPFEFTPKNLKTHFDVESMESFLTQIRNSLERIHAEETERATMVELRLSLGRMLDFPVPETLVQEELKRLLTSVLEEFQRGGTPLTPRQEMAKQLLEKLTPQAVSNVRVSLALEKIAELAGVKVTEEEVNIELSRLARETGSDPQQFFRRASEGIRDRVSSYLRERKALEILRQNAEFEEIPWEAWENQRPDRGIVDHPNPLSFSPG
jgi:trigger factor